jgi:hypothetical protein
LSREGEVRTEQLFLAFGLAIASAVVAAILLVVPWQAYRRGHGFVSWFILQIVALNPVYPLILLATLPNKARARLREEFARELDRKLAGAAGAESPPGTPDRTAADRSMAGSVGDLPTFVPPAGSIGDDVTRP